MGKAIGELAGFAMLLLIGMLFLNMLKEFGLADEKKALLVRKLSLCLWGAGMFYLALGGFFYNISIGQASIFQYDVVWGYGNYAQMMEHVEDGNVQGVFSGIYLLAVRGIGRIFFQQYLTAAIYTSFLFAIAGGILCYFILLEMFDRQNADKLILLACFCPFAHKLFLPSPASMVCFIAVLAVWGVLHLNKNLTLPKVKIRISDWLYYFFLCMFTAAGIMIYYKEMLQHGSYYGGW